MNECDISLHSDIQHNPDYTARAPNRFKNNYNHAAHLESEDELFVPSESIQLHQNKFHDSYALESEGEVINPRVKSKYMVNAFK